GYDLALRLGAGIRHLREQRGLTQAELAHQANIKTQTLVKIEHGEENPCMDTIEGLCSALETDLPLLLVPLAGRSQTDRNVPLSGQFIELMRETLHRIDETPAAQDIPYPPIKRRRGAKSSEAEPPPSEGGPQPPEGKGEPEEESGSLQRVHVGGCKNVQKRLLVHVSAFSLGSGCAASRLPRLFSPRFR